MGIVNLLTKNNLDFFRKLQYVFLATLEHENCKVNFWTADKEAKGYVQNRIFGFSDDTQKEAWLNLLKKVFATINFCEKFEKKFKYLDIVFHVNYDLEIQMIFGQSSGLSLGNVTEKDIDSDRNIINLNLKELEKVAVDRYRDVLINRFIEKGLSKDEASSKVRYMDFQLKLESESAFESALKNTLTHELTHLWHVKASEAYEARKRNDNLFYAFIRPEKKYDAGQFHKYIIDVFDKIKLGSCTSTEYSELIEILKKYYLIIRYFIENFSYSLAVEGMANFIEAYLNNTYNYEAYTVQAEKAADRLDNDFKIMLKSFERLANKLIKSAKNRSFEDVLDSYLKEFTQEPNKDYQIVYLFISNTLKVIPYHLGPVIPATLFEYGMQIKEIGLLNPHELISKYEEICVLKGIRPLISNDIQSESNAVFNISEAGATFNALRRELGITSLPQK